ncbi:MAG: HAMP domain-containing histidine kinase [Clostridiales bacterium]|nr:HAMP domain-containing histidine kinase [Clostridiales bacterium]
MKKLKGSPLAKTVAIILLTATVLAFAVSALGVTFLAVMGVYPESYQTGKDFALGRLCADYSYRTAEMLYYGVEPEEMYTTSNYCFQLYDQNGNLLYDGLKGRTTQYTEEYSIGHWYDYSWLGEALAEEASAPVNTPVPTSSPDGEMPASTPEITDEPEVEQPMVSSLKGYILKNRVASDNISFALDSYERAYGLRYELIAVALVSLIISILLFVFLMSAAGHRDGSDTITPNFIDRIPFDLFTAVMAIVICCPIALGIEVGRSFAFANLLGLLVAFVLGELLLFLFFMSLSTRLKLKNVVKSCLIYRILCWCWRLLKKAGRLFRAFIHGLPLLGRTGFAVAAVLLVEFIYICATEHSTGAQLFGWFVERAVLLALLVYLLACVKRLRTGASKIARGDMNYSIDTKYMHGDLLDHANDLNSIRDGISRAVNERMKSEHFKTELITNVSHDIKTPLTSIVNYVDLLSKENIENEKAQEYIEVLQRQSARLKKLTEDLVEASKASTGNLTVNLERCELGVLLDQTAGEYGEKLSAQGLELILKKPEEPVTVLADGRHLWRILDNLMNNICKYAQPGTRVYLNLEKQAGKAVMTFRNVSKYQLNISGDELMERFVRGDSSRNTEGSGLGLSIARSLAQLQGAQLDLMVDGDLFKVTVTFDAV